MKTSADLRERTSDELVTLVGQLEDDLFKLRLQRATNQNENIMSIRHTRRDIARAHTELSRRRLGAARATALPEEK